MPSVELPITGLKPCPFCGGRLRFTPLCNPPGWQPECDGPADCIGHRLTWIYPEARPAYEAAWNRRASPPEEDKQLKLDLGWDSPEEVKNA